MKSTNSQKSLYVVATPIGNLADMSQRAREVLAQVDLILCENTEHSLKLLNHYGVRPAKMKKLTDHDSEKVVRSYLDSADHIAVISDAGTPLVSDPGHRLVSLAHQVGFNVLTVPGPSAAVAALSICPFEPMPCSLIGFMPRKKGERIKCLERYAKVGQVLVCYESPRRLLATLDDVREVFGGDHPIFVVKELTKRFETAWSGSVVEVLGQLAEVEVRGEFVVIVDKLLQRESDNENISVPLLALIDRMLCEDFSTQTISRVLDSLSPLGKNHLYQTILQRKQDKSS